MMGPVTLQATVETTSVATTGFSGFTLGAAVVAVLLGYYLFRR